MRRLDDSHPLVQRDSYNTRMDVPMHELLLVVLNRDGCLSKDTRTTLSSLAAEFSCAPGEEVRGKEGWCAATKERYAFNIALLLRCDDPSSYLVCPRYDGDCAP